MMSPFYMVLPLIFYYYTVNFILGMATFNTFERNFFLKKVFVALLRLLMI